MHCGCGFLMHVREGGGFACSRCGATAQVPVVARVNPCAAACTDQHTRPKEPAPVRQQVEPIVAAAPAPEIKSDPVVPRSTARPAQTFGRGGKK